MLQLGLVESIREAIWTLMRMGETKDLIIYAKQGVVAFAVVREDMYQMFSIRIGDTGPSVNYLISKEIVSFMFTNDTIILDEDDTSLILKSEGKRKEDFRQAIVPLRRDYNFNLLEESIQFMEEPEVLNGEDIRVISNLTEICKFQNTGIVIQDGYGMISTHEMKAFRPVNYGGRLVLSNSAMNELLKFSRTNRNLGVGTVGRYTVCLGDNNHLIGFVNVRESIQPFIKSYKKLKCRAVYSVDVHALALPLFSIKQEKTQQISVKLNFDKGMIRIYERNKGEVVSCFYSQPQEKIEMDTTDATDLVRAANESEIQGKCETQKTHEFSQDSTHKIVPDPTHRTTGDIAVNFKLIKSLLTTRINFGTCIVKVFDAVISFELSNGTVLIIKQVAV